MAARKPAKATRPTTAAKKAKPAKAPKKAPAKRAPAKKAKAPKAPAPAVAEKKPTGRPSSFSQAVADRICERLTHGESLRTICRDEDMPATSTVCKWLNDRPAFSEQYARAREAQADALFDEILDIADETRHDWSVNERGAEVVNNEAIARSRLRVDARKWMASKLAPKKYGEKLAVGGAEDLPPISSVQTVTVDPGEAYKRMMSGGGN